jgi:hypothetical protein
LVPRDDVEGVPRLAEGHLVKWSPDHVTATTLDCQDQRQSSQVAQCQISFGKDLVRVQSVETPKPGLRQHRVQVLRQIGDSPDAMVETITLEFQGPKIDGVQYDQANPQRLVFSLELGLGSASVAIGRDDLLHAACGEGAESEVSTSGHLPSFNDFMSRRDEWMKVKEPCS